MVEPGVISAITQAVEKDPENVDLRLSLAALLIDSGQARAALDHCVVVLGRAPDPLEALARAARAATALGEVELAARYEKLRSALSTPEGDGQAQDTLPATGVVPGPPREEQSP